MDRILTAEGGICESELDGLLELICYALIEQQRKMRPEVSALLEAEPRARMGSLLLFCPQVH